jgi:hypothetical protein
MKRLDAFGEFNGNAPPTPEVILAGEKQLKCLFPNDYGNFIKGQNGGEGFLGNDSYLILWAVEELEPFNRGYEVESYCPELLLFGSNGSGEAYAFDKRSTPWPVVQVPFVGMDYSLCAVIGNSFSEFIEALFNKGFEPSGEAIKQARINEMAGKEVFEIHPIILGGNPKDPANKAILTRQQHMQAVAYWNREIQSLRKQK